MREISSVLYASRKCRALLGLEKTSGIALGSVARQNLPRLRSPSSLVISFSSAFNQDPQALREKVTISNLVFVY